jgi:hypothetical protein
MGQPVTDFLAPPRVLRVEHLQVQRLRPPQSSIMEPSGVHYLNMLDMVRNARMVAA